ncbi:MAG: hypothetical protein Q8Q94_01770 [bacterium]|nr:hypothetical protein [bacterium]MDZ4299478.1 hypothetical protein [Candidatus Sungbacteria bacterium]
MPRHSQQDVKRRYEKLPPILKEALFSADIAEKMFAIGVKNTLTIEQIGAMSEETGYIILGLTAPKDFVEVLAKRLGMEREITQKIAQEINHSVLALLREALMATYQTAMTEEDIMKVSGGPHAEPARDEAHTSSVRISPPELKFKNLPPQPFPPQKTFTQTPAAPPKTGTTPPMPPAAPVMRNSSTPPSTPPPVFSPTPTQKTFRQIPPPPPPPSRDTPMYTQTPREKNSPSFTAPKNQIPSVPKSGGVALEHVMPKFPPAEETSLPPLTVPPLITSPHPLQKNLATAAPAPTLPKPITPGTPFLPAPPLDLRSQQRPSTYKSEASPSVPLMDPRTSLDLRLLTRQPAEAIASPQPAPPKSSIPPHPIPTPPLATHSPSPATPARPPQSPHAPTSNSTSASDPYREPVGE